MKKALVLACVIAMSGSIMWADDKPCMDGAEKLGWKLAVQAWSFHRGTFFEAVDKTAAAGISYIEAFPGQKIDKDIDGKIGPGMSAEQIKAVKDKLAASKVKVVGFGVCGLSKDEASSRKTFEWCKEMGIEVINTEAREDAFPTLAKLAKEFNIKAACTTTPSPPTTGTPIRSWRR